MLTIIIIAISLSMDAFSLALVLGMSIDNKSKIKLALIVGLFHFFMPLIGMAFGKIIINYFFININFLMFIIFFIIGIEMIISSKKEKEVKLLNNNLGYSLFALTVSIDSLTIGITLNNISNNYIITSFIFLIMSFLFTYIGLIFGNKLKKTFGNLSTFLGGLILIIMAFEHLLKK